MTLSLLTVSRDPHPTDWFGDLVAVTGAEPVWIHAPNIGTIEYVLDDALTQTHGDYILRLDDDEWASPPLVEWLVSGAYQGCPHWRFPRLHRWGTGDHVIVNGPLYPDWQTRLSIRSMAGGRHVLHGASPFGSGTACLSPIMHDKFLKPYADRVVLGQHYETLLVGGGLGGMRAFTLPEDEFDALDLAPCPWRCP